jgi:hypothetical protein
MGLRFDQLGKNIDLRAPGPSGLTVTPDEPPLARAPAAGVVVGP